MTFADNLRQLPAITHLAALHLLDATGTVVAAAREGLELFAEHTDSARAHPGSHPNIDRLLDVIASGTGYAVQLVPA